MTFKQASFAPLTHSHSRRLLRSCSDSYISQSGDDGDDRGEPYNDDDEEDDDEGAELQRGSSTYTRGVCFCRDADADDAAAAVVEEDEEEEEEEEDASWTKGFVASASDPWPWPWPRPVSVVLRLSPVGSNTQ